MLRALSPHRSSGGVLAAARLHRHYGLRLYRVPALNLFMRSTSGGATLPPSRPTSAFSPCSGLVARLRANKGATARLPFRSRPLAYRLLGAAPPADAESGFVGALPLHLFYRLPL